MPPILGFPFVVRGLAYTVFSADIGYRAPTFWFLQNPNDLTFRESRFLHCRLLEDSLPEISTMRWSYFRGRVQFYELLFLSRCSNELCPKQPMRT